MRLSGQFALQKSGAAHVRYGSLATISADPPDVRSYPNSDRDSDLPDGRCVPIATKVHCTNLAAFKGYQAACAIRVSISVRRAAKSIGLLRSASAPPASALRLVSSSP